MSDADIPRREPTPDPADIVTGLTEFTLSTIGASVVLDELFDHETIEGDYHGSISDHPVAVAKETVADGGLVVALAVSVAGIYDGIRRIRRYHR